MNKVFITNGRNRISLVILRSLAEKGCICYVGDFVSAASSFFSRFCKDSLVYANPYKYPIKFVNDIVRFCQRHQITQIIPSYDEAFVLAKLRDRIPKNIILAAGNFETIMQLHSKVKLMEIAKNLNIKIPYTFLPKNIEEAKSIANEIRYPVVLKPVRGGGAWAISYVNSKRELISVLESFDERLHNNKLMIQQYLKGPVYCYAVVRKNGKVYAKVCYEQLRQFPLTGGTATLRESKKEQYLEDSAEKLLNYLSYEGVCEFDFIKHGKDFYLIDANPRFWGSIFQAIVSGIDFPWILLQLYNGDEPQPQTDYKIGVKSLWIWGDIRVLIMKILKEKNKLLPIYNFIKDLIQIKYYDDFYLNEIGQFLWYPISQIR